MQYLTLYEIDSENISEVLNNILSERKHQTTHYCCSDRRSRSPPSMQCGFFTEKSINFTSLNSILDPPPYLDVPH